MRPIHAPDWAPGFLDHIQAQRPGPALDCLRQAHVRTHGFGPGWDEAFLACLRAGFASGCRLLLEWGIPLPSVRLPGSPSARAWAIGQAFLAEGGPRRAGGGGPAGWPPVFRLPDRTPIAPLGGEDPQALVEALCQPPAPALSPAEWRLAWDTHRPLARQVLEQGRVRPWAGKAACSALADVLPELLDPSIPSTHPDLAVLLAHLPTGRAAASTPLCKRILEEIHRHGERQLMIDASAHRPLARAVGVLLACGQSLAAINRASMDGWGESVFVLAVRYNEPAVFRQALDAGLSPWSSRCRGPLTAMRSGETLLQLLAHRLARQSNQQAGDLWWEITGQLATTPEGVGWWRRPSAPAAMDAGLEQGSLPRPAKQMLLVHRERWDALCRAARLSHAWTEPEEPACAAPPTAGRPRL